MGLTNMKMTEINCETGIETIRDMTPEELANYNKIKNYVPENETAPE